LLFNAHSEELEFMLPPALQQWNWQVIIDTRQEYFIEAGKSYSSDQAIEVVEQSIVVLQKL
jgi:glycogen operon protein